MIDIDFHPLSPDEWRKSNQKGLVARFRTYPCGACGDSTNGRVMVSCVRSIDSATIEWCLCSCKNEEPTVVISNRGGTVISQLPLAREFRSGEQWPADLARLFDEAAKAYAAGAHTASAMASRKILMSCACEHNAREGETFVFYINYILDNVLTFPAARTALVAIKDIGNDANHKITFVTAEEAGRALRIVTYMLHAIYSLPTA